MNNKGAGLLIAIVIAVMIFAAGMLFMNFIKDDVTSARLGMDCTNSTISDGAKVTCLGIDIVIPYFILGILSSAGGIIVARFMI